MHILFVTATRIGDAVLSTGLLSHVIARHPGARLTIAAGPVAAPLFEAVAGLERIVVLEKQRWGRHWLALYARTARRRWDLVVDLRGSAIAWLLRVGERRVMAKGDASEHRVRQLGRLFGLDPPPSPVLWTAPRHERAADELLPPGAPVLAIGPAANWRGKQWRAERFADLARRLTAADGVLPGARIAVLAAAHERAQAEPLLAAMPAARAIDLVGRTDLLTAAAVLRRCALFIGNDTGLMHIAAACGAPTLGLFGPSPVEQYAPWGRATAFVRTAVPPEAMFAAGFDHRTTETLMDSLTVEMAEAAAHRLWRRGERSGMSLAAAEPAVKAETSAAPLLLSALVVARNEAAQLAECLSCLAFADEIVVVLDRCEDRSREIAGAFTEHVVEGTWEREGPRRNAGIAACRGEWILEIDADERVGPELAAEICTVVASSPASWHLIPVDNYVGEHLVRWGWGASFGRSAHAGLFRRDAKLWGNERVHPAVSLSGTQGAMLAHRLVHLVDRSISDMLRRLDRYTSLRAQDLRDSGDIGTFGHNLRRIASRFWKCYIGRRGYREGPWGFLIALCAALYPILSYLKARLESE